MQSDRVRCEGGVAGLGRWATGVDRAAPFCVPVVFVLAQRKPTFVTTFQLVIYIHSLT